MLNPKQAVAQKGMVERLFGGEPPAPVVRPTPEDATAVTPAVNDAGEPALERRSYCILRGRIELPADLELTNRQGQLRLLRGAMAAAIRAGPGPRQSGGPRRRHPPPRRQGVRRAARRLVDRPRPAAVACRPGAAAPVGAATMKLVPLTDGWSLAAVAAALVLGLLLALGGRGLR